jgi:hypothetical protein
MAAHDDHGFPFKTSPSLSFYEHLRGRMRRVTITSPQHVRR